MRKKRALAAVAAIAVGAILGLATPSSADQPTGVQILGPVRIDGDVATVRARYNCEQAGHLFVSVKQTGDRNKDARLPQPGSSAVVAETGGGWWQSHPQDFNCDGETHVGTFTIGTFEYGISALAHGKGWLQFCLSFGEEEIEINHTQWVQVI